MFRARNGFCGTVAGRAISRCGLIEEHGFGGHHSREFVALHATYILMRTTQRKLGPRFVVKEGGFPLHAGVAVRTARDVPFGELLSVDILMTIFALAWRGLEVYVDQPDFKIRRFVAIDAGRGAMRAQQSKLRLRMVERRYLLPRLSAVASLTADSRCVGSRLRHALLELSFVRIDVATGAV